MKVGIMQPYFFPYIGYFQLINLVDVFVVYDEIEYTKKGWINRNRILSKGNGTDELITIPIKKDSDFLNVNQRFLADDFLKINEKTLRKIKSNYSKSPFFTNVYPLLQNIFLNQEKNLFHFIYYSLKEITSYLNINTELVISSSLDFDNGLKGEEKVISICKSLNASEYLNPSGGTSLYKKENFLANNINLEFIKPDNIVYKQFGNVFIESLSIIDVMMFNAPETISIMLNKYKKL